MPNYHGPHFSPFNLNVQRLNSPSSDRSESMQLHVCSRVCSPARSLNWPSTPKHLRRYPSYLVLSNQTKALLAAAGAGQEATLQVIIDHLGATLTQAMKDQALAKASLKSQAGTAKILVESGAHGQYSLLADAVRKNNDTLVKALEPLQLGTQAQRTHLVFKAIHQIPEEVYPSSVFDITVPRLNQIRSKRAQKIALSLIALGVNLRQRDFWQRSMLGIAAAKGSRALVEAIVRFAPSDVSYKDFQGNTPLHLALNPKGSGTSQMNPDVRQHLVAALLDQRADPLAQNLRGDTAITLAAKHPMPKTLALLLQH